MNLFFLTSRFPFPLDRGDKLRAYHQIKVLSKHFDIQLISLSDTVVSSQDLAALQPFCSSIEVHQLSKFQSVLQLFLGIFIKRPFQVSYFYSPNIQNKILKQLRANPDVKVVAQLIRMRPYVLPIDSGRTVLDFQDAFSLNMKRRASHSSWWNRWFFQWESALVKDYEGECINDFGHCAIISEPDRLAIEDTKKQTIFLLKNGVDVDYFNIQNIDNQLINEKKDKKITLSFVANLGYFPNIIASEYLVNKIFDRLDAQKYCVLLAGARPAQKVKNLASENVNISGWYDDIRNAYLESDILVAPIFSGSGQQNKILEALAMQVPVVTTSQVAAGINATEAVLMIANTPSEFQTCIELLSDNQILYKKYQVNGRMFVEKHFSWEAATLPLCEVLKD